MAVAAFFTVDAPRSEPNHLADTFGDDHRAGHPWADGERLSLAAARVSRRSEKSVHLVKTS